MSNRTTFQKIYWAVFEEFDLSPMEGLLLYLILGLSRNKGYCYASKLTLGEILNVTDICVYNTIARLVKKELVKKIGKTKNGVMALQVTDEVHSFISDQDVSQNPH